MITSSHQSVPPGLVVAPVSFQIEVPPSFVYRVLNTSLYSAALAILGFDNVWKPADALKLIFVFPAIPFLVVIRMTPLEARVP